VAPTERIDNTPLTDLAGYQIHYGQSSNQMNNVITVSNPGLTTFVVENLPSGAMTFAIRAYDSIGQFSALSNKITRTVP